jgi:BMFP domain-containing protein YqiC|tara:strand:- start:647 stop:892 length:246 start_codon:yes stop_codon:yes gene_type:complete
MSKSKILIDRLAKLIEEGMLTSKDIADEFKNSLNYKKENVITKLNLVTRDEFEIQKARLDKIQEEFGKLKRRRKTKKVKKS